jgi:alcohol dehydrogenase class IV
MLSQLDARFTASADAEAVARSATDQMAHDLESLAAALRRPVSLLHGMADSWPHHRRRGTGEADPALDHLTAAAARVEALLDEADSALFTDPARAKPDKTPSSRTGSVKSGPAA